MRRESNHSNTAGLLIAVLLVLFGGIPAVRGTPAEKSIQLQELLKGFSFTEQIRFKVEDIVVGTKSVKDLFDDLDHRQPTRLEYYTFKETTRQLRVSSNEKLAQLQQTLIAEGTDRLRVTLKDDWQTFWKHIPGLSSESLYVSSFEIQIVRTPCDEVTRIIYSSIDSIIRKKIEKAGTTDTNINLNEVFDKLLNDTLEPYLATLAPVAQADPCFKTFRLLKWIKGDDVTGFDSGEYRLHDGLQLELEPTIVALLQIHSNWSKYQLRVKVVGHTDRQVVITQKDFNLANSGIAVWDNLENPLNLRYSGCSGDRLTGRQPVYLDFVQNSGTPIKEITDNCKLGAARAYVATAYLRYKLGLPGVEYDYATGGVYSSSKYTSESDALKRRIDIEFTIRAASESDHK